MSLVVLAPGALTTVQDYGRTNWRHLGVALAGAMDPGAMAVANALVGNAFDAAVLEITLRGPTLALTAPLRLALVGAAVEAQFESSDGVPQSVPSGRPLTLPPGTLRLGPLKRGNRAWLAVAGGIAVPLVLGSRSTDLRGGLGGYEGRALRRDDCLSLGPPVAADLVMPEVPRWWIAPEHGEAAEAPIRFVPSAHEAAPMLAPRAWRVSTRCNRQGVRLDGPALPSMPGDEVSAAVAPGTIQLPPDGHPIVLLADAQTVGGYPRLGHVIRADLARLAQRPPGSPIRLQPCTAATASYLWREQRTQRQRLLYAIRDKLGWDVATLRPIP